jgi:hypothetical protein
MTVAAPLLMACVDLMGPLVTRAARLGVVWTHV